ncbi:MAG: TonB-dependent receptor [Steroidobacteraceae bacterium]
MTTQFRGSPRFPRSPRSAAALAVAGAIAGSIFGAVARAQSPPRDAPSDEPLETVTILGRVPRPLVATEASVSVIDATRLEDALALDLRDVAAREPGLSVRGDATRFGDDSISIRGIGGNRVRLQVDGVPRAAAFAVGNFASAGRALADLDFVRRIEILKGPASASYGSAAIGGIVTVATLDPVDLLRDDAGFAARARLQYGSADHARHGSLLAAGRARRDAGVPGGVEWLAGWLHQEAAETQNEWRVLDANPQDARNDAWLGKLVLAQWDEPLRLTVAGRRRQVATRVNSLVLAPGRFANTIAMTGDDRSDESTVALDRTLLDVGPFRQLAWNAWWQRSGVDQLTFETRRAVAPRTPAAQIDRAFHYDADAVGATLVAALDFDLAGMSHRASIGAEASRQRIEESRDGLQTTLPSGPATNAILGEVFPVRDFPTSRVLEAGVFAFDEIAREGSRLSWSPALRIDHYRLDPRPDAVYFEDNPTQAPVAVHTTSVSPRLGVSWRLRDELSLFGQYTHGFRSPPFEDVNIGLDLPQFRTRAIPNPDLRPERSDHLELGLRIGGGRISGSASAFLADYRDFIESRVPLGVDPASGYSLFQSRNRARARIYGAEASFSARLGAGGEAPGPWLATLGAGFAHGEDRDTGRPLNSIDPPRATLSLAYAPAQDAWRLEGVLTATAAQDRIDESAGRLARAPGHATLDVIGAWQVAEGVHLRAAVLNVFDRRYVEWADVRGRAFDDPSLDLYTRPGRSVTRGVTLRLD